MAFIRLFLISLLAALAGSAVGSVLLFGELSRGGIVTFPFTSAGSILLLAPLYAAAREAGVSAGYRYARLLIAGGIAGGLILAFISYLTDPFKGAAIGAAYGVLTAVCWVAVHATMSVSSQLCSRPHLDVSEPHGDAVLKACFWWRARVSDVA